MIRRWLADLSQVSYQKPKFLFYGQCIIAVILIQLFFSDFFDIFLHWASIVHGTSSVHFFSFPNRMFE